MRPILADSSWYIAESRAKRDPLLQLAEISISRDIAVCGVIMTEVGRGIILPKTLRRYQDAWACMRYVNSSPQVWQQTLDLAWQLDREGKILPLQDIHIAACAISIHAVLLTCDAHFQQIPGIDVCQRIL